MKKRKFSLSKQASDSFKVLPAKQFRQLITKSMDLMNNMMPNDCKSLSSGYKRCDVGEYRIVYCFDDDCVYIELIDKRNDDAIYKKLRNLMH